MADNDVEMQSISEKSLRRNSPDRDTRTQYSNSGNEPNYGDDKSLRQSYPRRILDSFKRDPNARGIPSGASGGIFDPHAAAAGTAESPLARKLKGRHLQMIAIGGSIGIYRVHTFEFFSSLTLSRNWSLRCLWQGSCSRRSGFSPHCLLPHWCYVILHGPCPRRNGCPVSCGGLLFGIFYTLLRSGLGFRYGLEVGHPMQDLSIDTVTDPLVMLCNGWSSCLSRSSQLLLR